MYALQLTQPCNELQTFVPMELVTYSEFMVSGADAGFSKGGFEFVSVEGGTSYGGPGNAPPGKSQNLERWRRHFPGFQGEFEANNGVRSNPSTTPLDPP